MDEHPRTSAHPDDFPRMAEIIGYGLLATAVAAGVLYLDGQRPQDIAVVTGAILTLLTTLILVAPRLRAVAREDSVAPAHHEEPAVADNTARRPDNDPPGAPPATTGSEPVSPDPGSAIPAGSATPGRRAKRGRRRR